jgi:hypothetical protein
MCSFYTPPFAVLLWLFGFNGQTGSALRTTLVPNEENTNSLGFVENGEVGISPEGVRIAAAGAVAGSTPLDCVYFDSFRLSSVQTKSRWIDLRCAGRRLRGSVNLMVDAFTSRFGNLGRCGTSNVSEVKTYYTRRWLFGCRRFLGYNVVLKDEFGTRCLLALCAAISDALAASR